MPDPAAVVPDFFDLPQAADPSARAAALLAPVPSLDDVLGDTLVLLVPSLSSPPPTAAGKSPGLV